eukprot:CAMPEP_0177784322 /NCGR_PEP_ID=MMETSP0491_2-20121128/19633_1 /TAXON_ID=63592 /ORGANISM="Tetraselmis chuii, Strain PLY429" /LENGTH=38 /DNA_ID= /DNA_START= /DNA_END= /DNA_ORIENTATION=
MTHTVTPSDAFLMRRSPNVGTSVPRTKRNAGSTLQPAI